MDKSQAFKILNLNENASRRKIELRFANLSRRIKNGDDIDHELINQAYNLLEGKEEIEDKAGKIALFYRKMMFHYKGWIFLSVFVLGIMAMIVIPMATRRTPDLDIAFAGEFGARDVDGLTEIMLNEMPETEDILVEVMYMDKDGESGEFDTGGRTRLTALLLTNDGDILVTDDTTFIYVIQDAALMPLDDIITEIAPDTNSERFVYGIEFETGEKKIFGIDVSENEMIDNTIYGEKTRIMCTIRNTKHIDAVKKAFEIILNDGSE